MSEEFPLQREVDAAIKATSAREAAKAYDVLFHHASATELRRLKGHSHLSIALRTAWEPVVRTISDQKQPRAVQPDPIALHRFIGFLEGRLNVPLPDWWEQTLLKAHAYERDNFFFSSLDKWPYERTESGLLARSGIRMVITNKDLMATDGNRSCRISSLIIETAERKGPVDALNMLIDENRCYVALHSNRCSPFVISCLDRTAEKVLWESNVWAAGGLTSYTGRGHHFITFDARNEVLFIFGAGDDSIYVEGFSLSDGSNQFRFSTSY